MYFLGWLRMDWFNKTGRALFRIPARLPDRWVEASGKAMGRALFFLSPHYRRIALNNLKLAFGNRLNGGERRRIALSSFENMALTLMETLAVPGLSEARLRERIVVDGLDHMRKALGKGKGVLVLTAHFGNWEIMSLALGIMDVRGHAVVRPLDFKPLDLQLTSIRTSTGMNLIPKSQAMRKIARALRKGEPVGILLDQSAILREGVFVDFFGHPACSDKGMARIALKTGAAVVPMFGLRLPDGRHRVTIHPEVELLRTGDMTRDVEDNTALFTKIIEKVVAEHPEQWLWMHRRWKQIPYDPWPRVMKKQSPPRWYKQAWTKIVLAKS